MLSFHYIQKGLLFHKPPKAFNKSMCLYSSNLPLTSTKPSTTMATPYLYYLFRFEAPELRKRIFHFSAKSIADLKAKPNAEWDAKEISSFQSLSALVWRAITRARRIPRDQSTSCMMAANKRARLKPALPEDYFGNMITILKADAKAGELVERGLGWSAWKLHETVMNNTNEKIRESLEEWTQRPYTYQFVQRRDGELGQIQYVWA
ncbi:unnamed protein product [Citrullus colocynthis]|uniref:Uncharacterized protein n=1 Tax=Citrullus colocynthis TaxID=252529 RepID=A0ABP0YDG4_9ROSI